MLINISFRDGTNKTFLLRDETIIFLRKEKTLHP
jgi:hypothetical protein